MHKLTLGLIRFYQKYLAFLNGSVVCRFEPRCSEYTYQAINKYGILRGGLMGIRRILSCNPLHKAGFDPVT
jgi:putative membrane protein insertion efficiency factor